MTVTEKDIELGENIMLFMEYSGYRTDRAIVPDGMAGRFTKKMRFAIGGEIATHREQAVQEAVEEACSPLVAALERLQNCDWVITPMDRMDAVREIARQAIDAHKKAMGD